MHGCKAKRKCTWTLAPEPRVPATIDAWFRASLMTKHPGPTSSGMTAELLAKPMPKVMAASFPRKLAISPSRASCFSVRPAESSLVSHAEPNSSKSADGHIPSFMTPLLRPSSLIFPSSRTELYRGPSTSYVVEDYLWQAFSTRQE